MKAKLTADRMYRALLERDPSFLGWFVVGVRSTGIFCRPTCRARKPKRENVEFFSTVAQAIHGGYRPCKVCCPLSTPGQAPDWIRELLVETHSSRRLSDRDLKGRGLDPNRVRRWFKKNRGMTFQAYVRNQRLGEALGNLREGVPVVDTAFETGYESLSGFTDAFKKWMGQAPSFGNGHVPLTVKQLESPLGPLLVGSVKEGICLLEFTDRKNFPRQLDAVAKRFGRKLVAADGPHLDQLSEELEEYFEGLRQTFTLPLAAPGTPFQEKVWNALLQIPYGQVTSYKQQSIAVGNPKAVRAVARANGQNRIAILIPCHRVIGSDGKLVGYASGLWRKKWLLEREGALAPEASGFGDAPPALG